MITKESVFETLKNVVDPELGMDIVTLGMVREIAIVDENVRVVIALTSDKCPLGERIKGDAERLLKGLAGVRGVTIDLSVMTEDERNRLLQILKEKKQPSQLPEKLPKKSIKRLIAILSGKGGVGKSSVTAMLAVGLAEKGFKVGILDADITGPSIPKIFGVIEAPFVLEGKIIPPQSKKGIKIMSMNLLIPEEDAPVIWRGPLVSSAIKQFYMDVDWGELDYLLIDLPPGTSDAQLTVLQMIPVDGIIVVTSPQELAGMIVGKAVQMSKMLAVPILGVVENMSYVKCPNCNYDINLFGTSNGLTLAQKINTKFLGSLPIDPLLSKACDEGKIEGYDIKYFKPVVELLIK
ncbi:MAG: Mrp/NBP35 family ATP-binding protein [Candidatus Methanomethylicia archaeon]|nr:Mrp/NBP35 family ATP-binding protein [Candidatus Methanomethylicia archaeon]